MNGPSREEFDAKLETVALRTDGRIASIDAKLDRLAIRMEERFQHIDERFQHIDARFERGDRRMDAIERALGSLKTTVLVTALSSVIAIVLGVASFNASLVSNMLASFNSGREIAASQAELRRQMEATALLLKQMQERQQR